MDPRQELMISLHYDFVTQLMLYVQQPQDLYSKAYENIVHKLAIDFRRDLQAKESKILSILNASCNGIGIGKGIGVSVTDDLVIHRWMFTYL